MLQHRKKIGVFLVVGALLGVGSLFAHGPNDGWSHHHHTSSSAACAYACSQLGHGESDPEPCNGGVSCRCRGGT